jgi:hypothetical protein
VGWLAGVRPRFARCLGAVALFGCLGCATGPPSPAVRHAAVKVALIDGMPMPPFRKIREVQAVSCSDQLGRSPVMADAREGLKVEAARVGGNAVGNIICDVELAKHGACWEIARCTGDASCVASSTNPQIKERCD